MNYSKMSFRQICCLVFIWMIIFDVQTVYSGVIELSDNQLEGSGVGQDSIYSKYPVCDYGDDICVRREKHKKIRTEEVKKRILKALDLQAPPNISINERPSELTIQTLMQNYGIQKAKREIDREQEGLKFKTTQIIKVAEHNLNYSQGSQFSFVKTDQHLHIRRAHLMVYVLPNRNRDTPNIACINISIIPQENGIIEKNITYPVIILSSRGHWKKIDLTSDLTEILSYRNPLSNIFLSTNTSEIVVNRDDSNLAFTPYIDLVIHSRKRRSRRSLTSSECLGPKRHLHCCNYELFILFSQIGWDWILYPSGFDARYCTGSCEFAHLRSNMRSKAVSHVTSLSPSQANSCCAPSKMESVQVLYQYDGAIKFNALDSLKITDCDCL